MKFDRQKFLDGYIAAFGGTPKPDAQAGIDALLTAAEADQDITDIRWLAYMMATVKHECANTWRPIEEFGKGKGRKYGVAVTVTDPAGQAFTNLYYGRGFVQLTWKDNYQEMGQVLQNRLVYEPALALDAEVAYRILSHGMRKGSFTGKKLVDYISADRCDYVNARKIINGLDQADRIAGYATALESILRGCAMAAVPGGVPVLPAEPAAAEPSASGLLYTITGNSVNLRSGPGVENPTVTGSPLVLGTLVQVTASATGWKHVQKQGMSAIQGWVAEQFVAPSKTPSEVS